MEAPRPLLLLSPLFLLLSLLVPSFNPSLAIPNPEDFANPLVGTFTRGDPHGFSTGNTLPLIGRPWGFNHFTVHNSRLVDGDGWFFDPNNHEFRWLRLTHQPSPWIGDWGCLLFGPQMGGMTADPTMFWEPRAAKFTPYEFDAMLGPDGMRVRMTPTEFGVALKVTFPNTEQTIDKRVCVRSIGSRDFGKGRSDTSFTATANKIPGNAPANFFPRIVVEAVTEGLTEPPLIDSGRLGNAMQCFTYHKDDMDVTVFLSTSLIDHNMAWSHLDRDQRGKTYEELRDESRAVWNEKLGRIDVVEPGPMTDAVTRRLTVFYTGLHRSLMFPRRLDEPEEDGKRVHRSPYDSVGKVADGPLCTDNGFWDTFRTVYPLLNLAFPEDGVTLVNGWLNAYKSGGWLPQWSSPGYRDCMVGTFSDNIIADAIVKGLQGIDLTLAAEALRKDSFGGSGKLGKGHFYEQYDSLGYISTAAKNDYVSTTLDFGFSDYAVAAAFEKIGGDKNHIDATRLQKRGIGARTALFNSDSGLMQPKHKDGRWANFIANRWGNGYVEGSAWHHSFPPYDLQGLASLHGSREKLAQKIADMLNEPGTFQTGSYGQQIHEMTEMRGLAMGQYGHNNQPSHHVLHLLGALDGGDLDCLEASRDGTVAGWHSIHRDEGASGNKLCPRRLGEAAIHHVLEHAYGRDFYAGDEDNGEMGAWFVLSALGLFDPAPGTGYGYALGSPLFRKTVVKTGRGDERTLVVESHRAGTDDVRHVHSILLDGEDITDSMYAKDGVGYNGLGWRLQHEDLVLRKGGTQQHTLRFVTGAERISDGPTFGAVARPSAVTPVSDAGVLRRQQAKKADVGNHVGNASVKIPSINDRHGTSTEPREEQLGIVTVFAFILLVWCMYRRVSLSHRFGLLRRACSRLFLRTLRAKSSEKPH